MEEFVFSSCVNVSSDLPEQRKTSSQSKRVFVDRRMWPGAGYANRPSFHSGGMAIEISSCSSNHEC
jgi:hypothetical protein